MNINVSGAWLKKMKVSGQVKDRSQWQDWRDIAD